MTPGRYDVQAYAAQSDVWRLENGASARFVPDDPAQGSRAAKLIETANSAAQRIDLPVLASINGGPIAVASQGDEKYKPRNPVSRLRLIAVRDAGSNGSVQAVPGRVIIDAAGQSFLSRAIKWAGKIVAAEWSVTS